VTTEIARQHYTSTVDLILSVQDNYSYHVRQFVDWLDGRPVEPQSIIDYFVDLNDRTDYAAGTKRIKRQAVKARLRQLRDMGELGSEFSERLDQFLKDLDRRSLTRAPKVNSVEVGNEKVVDRTDYLRLLDAAPERLAGIMEFLWKTGCRISEATGIRRGDVDVDGDHVRIRVNGKGSKERIVRIPSALYHRLRDIYRGEVFLFETKDGNAYNRSYVSREIARLGRKVLRRRIASHVLRHSFVTRMINKYPHKIDAISRYVGHSSVSITLQMYHHSQLSDNELFEEELVS
jgi:integrase/recombinase XerD